MPLNLTAAADDDGRRLDRILRKALRDMPLSAIHRLLRQGGILVNGETAAADRRVRAGEIISAPDAAACGFKEAPLRRASPAGQLPPAAILFEGAGLLVVNKPAGLEVHGASSLETQVLAYLDPKLPPSLSFRPGPLHRLDKPTSGAIAFSASIEGARFFSAMMRERAIKKFYLALLEGRIEKAEIWQDDLIRDKDMKKTFLGRGNSGKGQQGKTQTALTRITPLANNAACSLILAEIETGRSHQIRAQAAARRHPLVGDKKYGGKPFQKNRGAGGFMLHAWRMEFPAADPLPGLPGAIEAPLPDYFRAKIMELFGEDPHRLMTLCSCTPA
ncbi:MAG: RluA family pseudouridine synthase [Treponema sp.]|nr:RluA family pseudouridine synthase [Treponema sp.]